MTVQIARTFPWNYLFIELIWSITTDPSTKRLADERQSENSSVNHLPILQNIWPSVEHYKAFRVSFCTGNDFHTAICGTNISQSSVMHFALGLMVVLHDEFPRRSIISTQADLTVQHYCPIMQYEPAGPRVTAFLVAFYGPRVARPVALAAKQTARGCGLSRWLFLPSFLPSFSYIQIRTCYWPSADHGRHLQWTKRQLARPRQRCNWRRRSE